MSSWVGLGKDACIGFGKFQEGEKNRTEDTNLLQRDVSGKSNMYEDRVPVKVERRRPRRDNADRNVAI